MKFEEAKNKLREIVDQINLSDTLLALCHICVDEAAREAGQDGIDWNTTEARSLLEELKKDCWGTPLGRAAEWIKMADRLFELSECYDYNIKGPNFRPPPE